MIKEGREEEEHLKKKRKHPSLFQGLEGKKGKEDLCNKDEDKSIHPHPQSTLCLDVSLFGGIPPWSSHDEQKSKVSPQPCASMPSLFKGEANTTWNTLGKKHAYENHSFLYHCMHSFTLYMQAMTPKRSVIPYKLHGQLWAKVVLKHGHSLDGLREILHHDRC